jgi:hypothetical protein
MQNGSACIASEDYGAICTDVTDGLLVMKYNFAGQVVWSGVDSTRHAPSLAVASKEYFYFIRFLDVIRGR